MKSLDELEFIHGMTTFLNMKVNGQDFVNASKSATKDIKEFDEEEKECRSQIKIN